MAVDITSAEHRAKLFSELTELEKEDKGGWDQVFQLLGEGRDIAQLRDLGTLAEQFEDGQTALLDALKQTHGFLPWELPFIQLGLATGNIQSVYMRLVEYYLLFHNFCGDVKRHAWPPLLLIVGGGIAMALTGYLQGHLSAVVALVEALLPLLLIAGGWALAKVVIRRYQLGQLSPRAVDWLYRLPGLGSILGTYQTYHFFCNLSLCLNTGMPLQQGLKLAAKRLPYSPMQVHYLQIHRAVDGGAKLSQALSESGVLTGIPLRRAGSGAGANDAYRLLTDGVHSVIVQLMAYWSRWLPLFSLLLIPVLLLLHAAALSL